MIEKPANKIERNESATARFIHLLSVIVRYVISKLFFNRFFYAVWFPYASEIKWNEKNSRVEPAIKYEFNVHARKNKFVEI